MTDRKGKKKNTSNNDHLQTGKLEIVRSGMGFVKIEGLERDVLIHKEHLRTALDGDEVRVEITKESKHGRQEGRVREVVTRKQNDFTGRLEVKEHFAFLIPDKENMTTDVFIPLNLLHNGNQGEKAIVRMVKWRKKAKTPMGEVTAILTNESQNNAAMLGILTDAGFPLAFPDDVL